jgi:hypothetical protein
VLLLPQDNSITEMIKKEPARTILSCVFSLKSCRNHAKRERGF